PARRTANADDVSDAYTAGPYLDTGADCDDGPADGDDSPIYVHSRERLDGDADLRWGREYRHADGRSGWNDVARIDADACHDRIGCTGDVRGAAPNRHARSSEHRSR